MDCRNNIKILFGYIVFLLTISFSVTSMAMPCHVNGHDEKEVLLKKQSFQNNSETNQIYELSNIQKSEFCEGCVGGCVTSSGGCVSFCNPCHSQGNALTNITYTNEKETYKNSNNKKNNYTLLIVNSEILFYKVRHKLHDSFCFTYIPSNSLNEFRVLLI